MKQLTVIIFAICLIPSTALGVDYELIVGKTYNLGTVSGGVDGIDIIASSDRCYCCEISSHTATGFGVRLKNGSVNGNGSPTLSVTSRGRTEPLVNFSTTVDTGGDGRVCFNVSNSTDSALHRVNFDILTGFSGTETVNDVTVSCRETSLVGGFNTSVTDFNFLEITNSLKANQFESAVVSGRILAKNAITDATIIDQTFTVNPGDRVDVDVHTAAGSGAFGPVFICHNGPQNSIKAVTSQYNITNQSPLTFAPVAQTVFESIGGSPSK